MKIVRSNTTSLRLSSIAEGEVFEYKDVLYLKTDKLVGNRRACIRLEDGHIDWLEEEESFVYKREAKMVVE